MIELRPERKVYKTSRSRREKAMKRRDDLRDLKLCVNGASHGLATHGCLCSQCRLQHRKSS